MIIKACDIGARARAPAYTCMTYFTSQNETNFDSKTCGICCFINNGNLVAGTAHWSIQSVQISQKILWHFLTLWFQSP